MKRGREKEKGAEGKARGGRRLGKGHCPLLSDLCYAHDSETPVLIQNSTVSILTAVF